MIKADQWSSIKKNVMSFANHKTHRMVRICLSSAQGQTPAYTARPQIRGWVSLAVPAYAPAFAGTHACLRRDGQAELTWVAGYIPRWFTRLPMVTHPSTNRARRWLTSSLLPTTLPTEPNRQFEVSTISIFTRDSRNLAIAILVTHMSLNGVYPCLYE